MSGGTGDFVVHHGVGGLGSHLLPEPFSRVWTCGCRLNVTRISKTQSEPRRKGADT